MDWAHAVELTGKGTSYVGEILDAAFTNGGWPSLSFILILEGAPLLSRLLRQGGDFYLYELRMPSPVPRPVPAKNVGQERGSRWI